MKSHSFTPISTLCWDIKNIILILSVTGAVVSCTEEPVPSAGESTKGIGVNILATDAVPTKSESADCELFDSSVIDTIGGKEIRMEAYVSDINPDCPGAETKGTIITGYEDGTGNITEFWMDAYALDDWHNHEDNSDHEAGEYFSDSKKVSRPSTTSTEWSIADSPKWLNDVDMAFWSWSVPISSSAVPYDIDLSNNKATISYSNNGAYDLIYAFNKEKRTFNRETGEITGGTGTYKDGSKDKMDIKLYHALSAVRFDISGLKNNGLTIKKIKIKNVVQKATCVITAPATSGDPLDFAWTPEDVSNNTISLATDFIAGDFTATGLDGTTSNALMPMSSDKFFFLIPQEVQGKGISIELLYEDASGTDVTKTASLNHSTKWEAGKYYTYKLTSDDAEYNFTLAPGYSSTQSFTGKKTSGSEVKYVKLKTQRKKKTDTSFKSWDYWDIQSYQIGSGSVVPVATTATSITAEDLIVTEDLANQQLKIESTRWISKDKGGHKYWTNEDGISGDDSGTGWSPLSWSDTKAKESAPLDLSKFNYKTETETSMNTANCYIVRHAGTYKIPLVYGNGVQNGSATEAGYKFTASGSTTNFLKTFKNHRDEEITSSFIENNSNCKAKDAVIKWQDRQEEGLSPVISGVSLTGNTATTYDESNVRYIQFTVSEADIRQTNAVIAVRDNTSSKNIMWSWHIWVTNDPAVKDGSIAVTNKTGDSYSFFPSYALGWIDPVTYDDRQDVKITLVQKSSGKTVTVTVKQATPDKLPATGTMYQWGRKDPFPSVDALTGFNTTSISSGKTLGAAIQDPGTFYMRTNNWCQSLYINLWSGSLNKFYYNGGISTSNDVTEKTIYDPSPVGYKVPSIHAFTNFSTTGAGITNDVTKFNVPSGTEFDLGWNFNTGTGGTIFFFAAGWRENNPSPTWSGSPGAGKIKFAEDGVGDGNYHSALHYGSTSTGNNMCYWSFDNLNMQMFNNQYQTLGCPVRPVEE